MTENIGINNITISSISHATEDEDKVLEAMAYFLPENIDDEDLEIETVDSEGCFGNPIFIHKITIDKSKIAKKVFNHIMQLVKSNERNITKLKKDIDLRLEKSKIYLRFDKQKAYLEECKLVDGDDVIRIIINFKIYVPKNKEQKVKEFMIKELEKIGIKANKIIHNPTYDKIIKDTLNKGEVELTNSGATAVDTGEFTGRSPKDKYFVKQSPSDQYIAWGSINQPISLDTFKKLEK